MPLDHSNLCVVHTFRVGALRLSEIKDSWKYLCNYSPITIATLIHLMPDYNAVTWFLLAFASKADGSVSQVPSGHRSNWQSLHCSSENEVLESPAPA